MGKITMADSIVPSFGIPFPGDKLRYNGGELKCKLSREELAAMPKQSLASLLELIQEQPKLAREEPLDWGWTLPSWEKCNELWPEAKCQVIFGGNRCLAGDTYIATDGGSFPIAELTDPGFQDFLVTGWDLHSKNSSDHYRSSLAFSKGILECVKVELELGWPHHDREFVCSLDHKVLAVNGEWRKAKNLKPGMRLQDMYPGRSVKVVSVKPVGQHECFDLTVDDVHNYWAEGCFHHNSSKTNYASALMMDILRKIPEANCYSLQTNEERSIQINQAYLYEYLSLKHKELEKKKGPKFTVDWSQKNGFSGDVCILPPMEGVDKGSACYFKNYSQYHNNAQAFEGLKGHVIHADEEIPYKLFETLFGRLGDYHGRIILTVTTLQGYTPLVNDLLKGAETLETRYAPLVGKELPILQRAKSWPDTFIHYWWTQDNPFIDSQEIVKSYQFRPINDKLARLYGIPAKSHSNQFPKFSRTSNVIPHHDIPFIKDPEAKVTRFLGVDPGDGKPWVCLWAGYTSDGNLYIYREFPDIGMGEWALPHQTPMGVPLGKKGPAQRPLGWGFQQWKEHIENIEGDEQIIMRWMDPNYCKQPVTKKEGQSNLLDEMAAVGMHFTPATYDSVGAGVAKMNELLEWDDTEPMSSTNRPKLFISDQCENLIQAMVEYTGAGKAEQWKDFIDPIRYIVVSGSGFLGEGSMETFGGGGY